MFFSFRYVCVRRAVIKANKSIFMYTLTAIIEFGYMEYTAEQQLHAFIVIIFFVCYNCFGFDRKAKKKMKSNNLTQVIFLKWL